MFTMMWAWSVSAVHQTRSVNRSAHVPLWWMHFKLTQKKSLIQIDDNAHLHLHLDEKLSRMNTYVQAAIEFSVPAKNRLSAIKRNTSDASTRKLYEVRSRKFSEIEAQGGTVSPTLRKRWHRKIRETNLADYKQPMVEQNGDGDDGRGWQESKETQKLSSEAIVKII